MLTVCCALWEALGCNRFARRRRELPRTEAVAALVNLRGNGPGGMSGSRGDPGRRIGVRHATRERRLRPAWGWNGPTERSCTRNLRIVRIGQQVRHVASGI